jgi:hypothetical protein
MNVNTSNNAEPAPVALVDCPTCGLPAEITNSFTLIGVPESVKHVKVTCIQRHWYVLPVDMFAAGAAVPEHVDDSQGRPVVADG